MSNVFNTAVYEYPVQVPHLRALDIEVLLDDLACGRLSTMQEEYEELKEQVAEETV